MGAWIPENQRDTRWYIWNKLFLCRVPNLQTMSVEYVQHFGMPCSGDAKQDQQTANELIDRMIPINTMVEYFEKGINVHVQKYTDTKIIYELISDHLNAWKQYLEQGVHTRNAPLDDLITLDKFANAVYAHAKYQFDQGYIDSLLARRLSNTFKVSREKILVRRPDVLKLNPMDAEEKEEPSSKHPERASMADSFAARRPSSGPKWK